MTVSAFPNGGPWSQAKFPEPNAARLSQLSDEVGRIASALGQLSLGTPVTREDHPELTGEQPDISINLVRRVIRARRLRSRFFDRELFADPVWEMLLELLQAEIDQHRVPVSSLCAASGVPSTTALRWIATMTNVGLLQRRADRHDGRRVFVELTVSASRAMRLYFKELGEEAGD